MKKMLLMAPALLLAACSHYTAPSSYSTVSYDYAGSRAAYDRVPEREAACRNHAHFDDCPYATQVADHVSRGPAGRVVKRTTVIGVERRVPQK